MTLSFNLRVIQGYFEPTLWRTIRIFVMGQKNNFLRKKEKSALRHLRGWQDSIWEVIQIKWYITICRKLKTLTKEQKIKKFIMWYTRTRQTINLKDTTVQPKAAVCSVRIQDSKSPPNNFNLELCTSSLWPVKTE